MNGGRIALYLLTVAEEYILGSPMVVNCLKNLLGYYCPMMLEYLTVDAFSKRLCLKLFIVYY